MGSILIQGMDVCLCFLNVLLLSCVGRRADPSSKPYYTSMSTNKLQKRSRKHRLNRPVALFNTTECEFMFKDKLYATVILLLLHSTERGLTKAVSFLRKSNSIHHLRFCGSRGSSPFCTSGRSLLPTVGN